MGPSHYHLSPFFLLDHGLISRGTGSQIPEKEMVMAEPDDTFKVGDLVAPNYKNRGTEYWKKGRVEKVVHTTGGTQVFFRVLEPDDDVNYEPWDSPSFLKKWEAPKLKVGDYVRSNYEGGTQFTRAKIVNLGDIGGWNKDGYCTFLIEEGQCVGQTMYCSNDGLTKIEYRPPSKFKIGDRVYNRLVGKGSPSFRGRVFAVDWVGDSGRWDILYKPEACSGAGDGGGPEKDFEFYRPENPFKRGDVLRWKKCQNPEDPPTFLYLGGVRLVNTSNRCFPCLPLTEDDYEKMEAVNHIDLD